MAVTDQVVTDRYAIYNGDCMEVMRDMPDGCIHFSVYSPPFATDTGGLYRYSSSERDLSNSLDYGQFFKHYTFVVEELFRLTMPGRMSAVHCMDVPSGNTGNDYLLDFPGDIIRTHCRCRADGCDASDLMRSMGRCGHGWFTYTGRYHIWKEPLAVRNRTYAKGLAHKTTVDDSSKCSVASADYLLLFRRRGANPIPIEHHNGFLEYAGFKQPPADLLKYRGWTGKQTENRFSHYIWRRYADAFWDDVRLERVLPYREAREDEDEPHVHPMQLDVIDRALALWSNPGETVFTPFAGVGSEVFSAVRNGRRGVGVELKPSYFRQMKRNMEAVDSNLCEASEERVASLFDTLEDETNVALMGEG
jgi:DNA methylase